MMCMLVNDPRYKISLARYLFAATITEVATFEQVRESSSLMLTAVLVVAALHIPGREETYAICHKRFLELIAASMFDRYPNLDDIRALCIGAFWLPDVSWKLSGHCIRMATELNLHQAYYKFVYSEAQTPAEREQNFEKAKLW